MNKIFIWIPAVILIIMAGGVFYFLYKPQSEQGNVEVECYDCGEGGWQKMNEKCSQTIKNKADYKNCLINFTWSSINQNTSVEEIKDGYIEIGGSEIKIFIYHQWAVDEDGNLYLLGQLG